MLDVVRNRVSDYNARKMDATMKSGTAVKAGRLSRMFGLAVLSAGMARPTTRTVAQVPGTVGQPEPRVERVDERPKGAQEAERYDPKGVPIGGFKFFGTLEADEVFNDNIYAVSNATGKTAAFIQLVNPSLELRSDWNNHMLNVYAKGGIGFYSVIPGSTTIRMCR